MYDAFDRYALYWVPSSEDPVARFGRDWTGWCADRGEHAPRRSIPGLAPCAPGLLRETARHGFHGVLVPPFRPVSPRAVWALEQALDHVATVSAPVRLPGLRPAVVEGRVALLPRRVPADLDILLGRARAALYGLRERGGAGAADLAARLCGPFGAVTLSGDRFHIPLTDPVAPDTADRLVAALRPAADLVGAQRPAIEEVALMGDPGGGRPLRVLRRYPLLACESEARAGATLETRGPRVFLALLERMSLGGAAAYA